ncbi:hypothetical protein F441_10520, partial [Phytophthora nicotianae CJ01A1]
YVAKRENRKWLNKSDDDIKKLLDGGEVPASIEALIAPMNQISPTDCLIVPKFGFPTE